MRIKKSKWWRRLTKKRTALFFAVLFLVFVFTSNRFFYLSYERVGILSYVQWHYQQSSKNRVSDPVKIGHRGSLIEPVPPCTESIGNTENAIKAAIAAGVDRIEIDVQETKPEDSEETGTTKTTGDLVVFHDKDVWEKTNLKELLENEDPLFEGVKSGAVSKLSLKQLQALKLNTNPSEQILSLDEVFEKFPSTELKWILDIKSKGIASKVKAAIEKSGVPHEQIMLFGLDDVLEEFAKYKDESGELYFEDIEMGFTTLWSIYKYKLLFDPKSVIARCRARLPKCKVVVVPDVFLTARFVKLAKLKGFEVWCYDCNYRRDQDYALGCGVKGIVLDDAGPSNTF